MFLKQFPGLMVNSGMEHPLFTLQSIIFSFKYHASHIVLK